MTRPAKAEDRQELVMTQPQCKKLVLRYMDSNNINDFTKDVVNRIGEVDSVDEINKWLGLAMNIWNNTPQLDRGGKSAREIRGETRSVSK